MVHSYSSGGTGFGKSKWFEFQMWEAYKAGQPFALLDPHGPTYYAVLAKLAAVQSARPIYLLNPSASVVVGFNPSSKSRSERSVAVNNTIQATVAPTGGDLNEMPTYERMMRLILNFAYQHNCSLPVAELLLKRQHEDLRQWAADNSDDDLADQWNDFINITTNPVQWESRTLSAVNRLNRFISSTAIRRTMALPNMIDIRKIMDEGGILLVNLAQSDKLDSISARVFGSLLLNEFFEAAMLRVNYE